MPIGSGRNSGNAIVSGYLADLSPSGCRPKRCVREDIVGRSATCVLRRPDGWAIQRRMNRWVARCAWVLALTSSSVRAEPAPETSASATAPTLTWVAPAPCPSAETLSREVEHLLKQPLSTPRAQAMQVDAVVTKVADGDYEVRIAALTAQGRSERTIRDADCTRLGEASALVIALAIEPTLASSHPQSPESATTVAGGGSCPPCPASGPTRSAQTCRQPSPHPPLRSPAKPRAPSWSAQIAVEGQASTHLLGKPGAGLALSAGMAYREQFTMGLVGRAWGLESAPIQGEGGASVGLRLTSVGLRACVPHDLGTLRVSACAGPELGDLQANGRGMRNPSTKHALWSALVASLGAAFPLTDHLTWQNRAEAGLGLLRPKVGVSDRSEAGESWRLVARPGQFFGVFVVSLGLDLPLSHQRR
jgi:hypothetical protein